MSRSILGVCLCGDATVKLSDQVTESTSQIVQYKSVLESAVSAPRLVNGVVLLQERRFPNQAIRIFLELWITNHSHVMSHKLYRAAACQTR